MEIKNLWKIMSNKYLMTQTKIPNTNWYLWEIINRDNDISLTILVDYTKQKILLNQAEHFSEITPEIVEEMILIEKNGKEPLYIRKAIEFEEFFKNQFKKDKNLDSNDKILVSDAISLTYEYIFNNKDKFEEMFKNFWDD